MCNGGFDQFFSNPTGILAAEALEGLRRVGAGRTAAVLAEAMSFFPGGSPPLDCEARNELLDGVELDDRLERFEPLEERFYDLMDEEIYARAAGYVRAHPAEFVRLDEPADLLTRGAEPAEDSPPTVR